VRRLARISLAAAAVALAAALPALGDDPHWAPTAADQAIAKRGVVQKADFAPGSGWSGGPTKAKDASGAASKCKLDPKQSDLVETGDAESQFKYKVPIVAVFSAATVYRTERMARLSWARGKPLLASYLRCNAQASLGPHAKLVSIEPIELPAPGTYGGSLRTTFDVISGSTKVRLILDVNVFGSGRTLFMLMQLAPYESASQAGAAESRLAAAMLTRASGLTA
jgi:hypothetical protein